MHQILRHILVLQKYQDEKAGKTSKDGEEKSEDSDDDSKGKPDFPDVDGDGDKKESIKKAQQETVKKVKQTEGEIWIKDEN